MLWHRWAGFAARSSAQKAAIAPAQCSGARDRFPPPRKPRSIGASRRMGPTRRGMFEKCKESNSPSCRARTLTLEAPHRAISSAVERFVHIEDVSGSNPLSPTRIRKPRSLECGRGFVFGVPSAGARAFPARRRRPYRIGIGGGRPVHFLKIIFIPATHRKGFLPSSRHAYR